MMRNDRGKKYNTQSDKMIMCAIWCSFTCRGLYLFIYTLGDNDTLQTHTGRNNIIYNRTK